MQRALRLDEQLFGQNHHKTATRLNNLAGLYLARGDQHAEPLLQQALPLSEEVLGPEHPEVAFPLTNLADLYREQGGYTEAEPLYQRALVREPALGSSRPRSPIPSTGWPTYREQGRYEEADALPARTLYSIQLRGAEHWKRLTACMSSRVYTNAQPAGAGLEPLSAGPPHPRKRLGPEHPARRKPAPAPLTSYACAGVRREPRPWKQLPASSLGFPGPIPVNPTMLRAEFVNLSESYEIVHHTQLTRPLSENAPTLAPRFTDTDRCSG